MAIPAESIPVEIMMSIPVADAAIVLFLARMWERPAVPITGEPSMTARSLIHPTTVANHWNLSAEPA